jgi:hypothetical protein
MASFGRPFFVSARAWTCRLALRLRTITGHAPLGARLPTGPGLPLLAQSSSLRRFFAPPSLSLVAKRGSGPESAVARQLAPPAADGFEIGRVDPSRVRPQSLQRRRMDQSPYAGRLGLLEMAPFSRRITTSYPLNRPSLCPSARKISRPAVSDPIRPAAPAPAQRSSTPDRVSSDLLY